MREKNQKNTIMMLFSWTIALLQLTKAKSAFEVYSESRKELSLKLKSNSAYSEKEFLGISWYIDYEKADSGSSSSQSSTHYDPLVRIAAVTTDGVYLKKFNRVWFEVDQHKQENREIEGVLTTVKHNPITGYHMDDNQTSLVIAFKNLTILTLNLSQPTRDPTKLILNSFDARYKYLEGDEEIRSIGRVPYSNLILFSPSRFEFFKIDCFTNIIHHRERSPLDAVRFIVTPVPTDNPKDDPHNPEKRKDPHLNDRVVKRTEITYFIATGHKLNTNALMDWTTMKAINYWTLLDREDRVRHKDTLFDVRSICFFGGSPRAHLYLMLGSNIIKKLYFFSGINRNIQDSEPLPKVSSKGQVTWINGTYYIYIIQENLVNEDNYNVGSYFLNLGPYSVRKPSFVTKYSPSLQIGVRYDYAKLMTFNMKITDDSVYDGIFDKINNFYFILYENEDSIEVRVPPFKWDFCKHTSFNPNLIYDKMFYGGYRDCGSTNCQLGFEKRTGVEEQKDQIFIDCQKKNVRTPSSSMLTLSLPNRVLFVKRKYL